jgi:hypothetical protein
MSRTAFGVNTNREEVTMKRMIIRLSAMEQINVTAEKTPVPSSEDIDSEIESILLDADALEAEEAEEE